MLKYQSIIDNHKGKKLFDFLLEKITKDSNLFFVSPYFTIYAYQALQEKLNDISSFKFLFGEPAFLKDIDPSKQSCKTFKIIDKNISLENTLKQKKIAMDCSKWIKEKTEIKSINKKNFLHSKMYYIENNKQNDAVLGSSNFTLKGLGISQNSNIELNLEINDRRDRNELKAWFEEIWNDETLTKNVKEEILESLKNLYRDNPPEFIYFKTLYHIFEKFLNKYLKEEDEYFEKKITETKIWRKLFSFQKDAVIGAINRLDKYNGCIIADSVGLGKTFEALAIIKYYEKKNYNILVLCPKKLMNNWTRYQVSKHHLLNTFEEDRFNYTVLAHTDLSREKGKSEGIDIAQFKWDIFDLIVIDESHNFRNNVKGKRDEDGNIIKKSRYERLMQDIIKKGVKTKVLLLSATPVNTDLSDLKKSN